MHYTTMKKEIEAAFLSVDKNAVRERFEKVGFTLLAPEYMMKRKVFDIPTSESGHNKWGRVRQESGKVTMTIKDVYGTGINDVSEVELVINDFETGVLFFEELGIRAKAFQETLREVWERGDVETTIDTWPGLAPFVEIEGPDEDTVRSAAEELGFDFTQAVFGPVGVIYEKELGIPEAVVNKLPEITFAHPPKKNAA